jgi:uncharacterized cupin superfamily protein
MSERRHPNIVNLSELEPEDNAKGNRFGYRTRFLGVATGGRGIGCRWMEVPPGKTAFPFHFHCANEESVFVLEGQGTLRIGADQVTVGTGDYISFPVGPDHAHQLLNTGEGPLRYLCFSTKNLVEVVGYPDSDKVGAAAMKGDGSGLAVRVMVKQSSQVDYYDGEDIG